MSGSPFKTVVLPAVLISTAVFSALTLSFVSHRSELLTLKLQPAESEEVQPISIYESKDFAIRYVGFTIILSVISGVLTVEGLRRLYAFHESMQIKKQRARLEQTLQVQEFQPQPAALVAVGQDIAVVDPLPEPTMYREVVPAHPFDDYTLSTAVAEAQFTDTYVASLPDWASLSEFDQIVSLHNEELSNLTASNGLTRSPQSVKAPQILESRQQYQTDRIHVPHLQQPQFAILVDGQYYSFVRTVNSLDAALKCANTFAQRGEQTTITSTRSGYAVWVWEPDAFPDLVA